MRGRYRAAFAIATVRPGGVFHGERQIGGSASFAGLNAGLQSAAETDTILRVLTLARATSPAWVKAAAQAEELILLDHAHCEKKAAATAVGFIFRYPEHPEIVHAMSRVAREELVHFERVLGEMAKRGQVLRRLPPSAYGAALYRLVRTWQPVKLLDELLISALIEARSCERFGLLADALLDPGLAALYRELGPAEERHTRLYLDLACGIVEADVVAARIRELAALEAEIVAAPDAELRLHAG